MKGDKNVKNERAILFFSFFFFGFACLGAFNRVLVRICTPSR